MKRLTKCVLLALALGATWVGGYKITPKILTAIRPSEQAVYVAACDRIVAGVQRGDLPARKSPEWQTLPTPLLLAHAGAGGLLYGNARECFDASIKRGFKVLEVDVSITSDGVPVCSHNFRPANDIVFEGVPTCAEFLATPVCGRCTPMTLAQFFQAFAAFDGYFSVDQTEQSRAAGFDLIGWLAKNVAAGIREKIIYQSYTFEDLVRLQREQPFGANHYCLGVEAWGGEAQSWRLPPLVSALRAANVTSVSFGDMPCTPYLKNLIATFQSAGIRVWVANVNNPNRYKIWRGAGVTCFDTDALLPSDSILKEIGQ